MQRKDRPPSCKNDATMHGLACCRARQLVHKEDAYICHVGPLLSGEIRLLFNNYSRMYMKVNPSLHSVASLSWI